MITIITMVPTRILILVGTCTSGRGARNAVQLYEDPRTSSYDRILQRRFCQYSAYYSCSTSSRTAVPVGCRILHVHMYLHVGTCSY